ncbi:hypothetical protein [Nonomuraea sp. SBT364]|uniref:hypothetical protein n=1 Tax=Nonomuraea sp. SBT364 TaxID=1580530 RepID=UPI0012E2389C|nr:hypothetical protein [Nonomuraea sp. SBT364]
MAVGSGGVGGGGLAAGRREYEVFQVGGRPLWEEVTDAYFRWGSRAATGSG